MIHHSLDELEDGDDVDRRRTGAVGWAMLATMLVLGLLVVALLSMINGSVTP